MADTLRIEKVISNLPNQLSPNTIYIVRRGTGFEMFVTDITGDIAHKTNETSIDDLKNRKLNFDNVIYFPDAYQLSNDTTLLGQTQTLTRFAEFGVDEYIRAKFANKKIYKDKTYKFAFTIEYTKGENSSNDVFEFGILNSEDFSFIKFTDINFNSIETGIHNFVINYSNGYMDSDELLFEMKCDENSTSKMNVLNICAYEIDENTNQYDLYDYDFMISISSLYARVSEINNNFTELGNRIDGISDKFNNVGVNLLYTEFTNPNVFNDYSQYIIEPKYTIEKSTLRNEINTWKFLVSPDANNEQAVYFNQNGKGDTANTQNIFLDDNTYIFSFYSKISRGNHNIKLDFIDTYGNITLSKTFNIGISPQKLSYMFRLSQGNYTLKFTLNPSKTLQNEENIFIEQMMIEASLNPDSLFSENPVVKPSLYVDGYGINNAVISTFAKLQQENVMFKNQLAENLLPSIYNPFSKKWSLSLYDYQNPEFETKIPTYEMILQANTYVSEYEYPDPLNIPLTGINRLHYLRVFIGGGSAQTIELSNLVTNGTLNVLLDSKSIFSTVETGTYNIQVELKQATIHVLDIITYGDGIRYSSMISNLVPVFSGVMQDNKIYPTVLDNSARIDKLERIWTNINVVGTVSDIIEVVPFGSFNGIELSISDSILYLRGAFKIKPTAENVKTLTPLFTIDNANYKPVSIGVNRFISTVTLPIDLSQNMSFGTIYDSNNKCIFTPFNEDNQDIWVEKKDILYVFNCIAIGNIQPSTGA